MEKSCKYQIEFYEQFNQILRLMKVFYRIHMTSISKLAYCFFAGISNNKLPNTKLRNLLLLLKIDNILELYEQNQDFHCRRKNLMFS